MLGHLEVYMQKSIDITTLAASYLAFSHKEAVSHEEFDEFIAYAQSATVGEDSPYHIETHSPIEIKGKPYFYVGRLGIELAEGATTSHLHRTYLTELSSDVYNLMMNTVMDFCKSKSGKSHETYGRIL